MKYNINCLQSNTLCRFCKGESIFVSKSILYMKIINYLMDTSIQSESTFVSIIHIYKIHEHLAMKSELFVKGISILMSSYQK